MTNKRHSFLWALFLLQALCTVFFISDAFVDFAAPEPPAAESENDALEYAVSFALLIGTCFTGLELRKLVQREKRMQHQLDIASGAFAEVLETHFETWGLTIAERDVAILAIKGCSVAEIAGLRQTKEGTIKAQNAAIYRKAGVSGRLQLLSLFIDDLMPVALVKKA